MYKNELLESLKNESSFIDENSLLEQYNTFILETKEDEIISPAKRLLKYNMETMIELKNKFLGKNENELINDENIEMLKSSINNYMDKYAEGQNDQKNFIRIITVYLTFIVKKPLHPEGMFDTGGKALYKNGKVVCPIREHEINKPESLCRFCVSTS